MGLLTQEQYNALTQKKIENSAIPPTVPTQPPTEAPTQAPIQQPSHLLSTSSEDFRNLEQEVVSRSTPVSPEVQQKRLEFQAAHPYATFFPRAVASSFGLQFPDDNTWDTLPAASKAAYIGVGATLATKNFVTSIPKEIAKTPFRIAGSILAGADQLITGRSAADAPVTKIPLLGAVPNYFQSYKEAKDSGIGKYTALLLTGSGALADAVISYDIARAVTSSFRPRGKLAEGETIKNTGPIQQSIVENKMVRKIDSSSEYYTMPKTVAKENGGNPGNTFLKITPAGSDSIEVAVVQTRTGPIQRTIDTVKGKAGVKTNIYDGAFGKEVKLKSEIVKIGQVTQSSVTAADAPGVIASIPPRPLKGFENKVITDNQVQHLFDISKVNGIDPVVQDTVTRTLTGKRVLGELSQKDYVDVAQTLARLNGSGKYIADARGILPDIESYASPTRYWMREVEGRTGVPVYTDGYYAMENAARLAKISESANLGQLLDDPIIQKYMSPKFIEERRLVRAYREGNTEAIIGNTKLTAEVKGDLIKAAKIFDDYYAKVGPDVGVPVDIFLNQYSPHISDIGGKFQLYKGDAGLPAKAGFFAKEKRTGSLATLIDDEWSLAEIYTRAGYKAKYYDPIFKRMNEYHGQLTPEAQKRFTSYVQEKLGYAGQFEKFMDSVSDTMNKKFGWNLPPDMARVANNQIMNTMYSSAMSQPATWMRNAFQYPTLGYSYWGGKFMGPAIKRAWSKEGIDEFLKSGMNVDLGVPFGEELTKTATAAGRVSTGYRGVTQSILKPNAFVEVRNRASMYFQTKMIFDDAVSRYNAGKITWAQAEKELGVNTLNVADQNIVRNSLVKGDLKAAFENIVTNALDDTQFPYRRGASSKFSYGMLGHDLMAFTQWPTEYIHTAGKWLATGQMDKLLRLFASSVTITNAMKESAGFDFSRSFGLQPLTNLSLSPIAKTVSSGLSAIYNFVQGNEQALEENLRVLSQEKKLAFPAGLEISNLKNMMKSLNAGPNNAGEYPVYRSDGSLYYYAPFRDIFWMGMGFPTIEKVRQADLQTRAKKEQRSYSNLKKQVLELYQEGRYEEANNIMVENQIQISSADFMKYYIPLNQRTFQGLPASLKQKFINDVYPQ